MICRRTDDGWFFITQPAHAWLSGELASRWGNQAFARPRPFEAVVLATRLHDCGWSSWDADPRVDETGRPVNFIATTLDETVPIWQRAVGQVSLYDPYAALLVSMHASTIYRRRLERQADPPVRRPEVETLLAEQAAYQQEATLRLSDHALYGEAVQSESLLAAYRWLRTNDLLSLALCANILPPAGELPMVPLAEPGHFGGVSYRLEAPYMLALNPWPFAASSIELAVQGRHLASEAFADRLALKTALGQAPWIHQPVTIRSGDW